MTSLKIEFKGGYTAYILTHKGKRCAVHFRSSDSRDYRAAVLRRERNRMFSQS